MELKYDLKLTDIIQFYLHTGKSSKINLIKMRNKKIKIFLISLIISFILQKGVDFKKHGHSPLM